MEIFYNAYTKSIDNKTYFFVKKYLRFPEFEQVADIQEGFGMHTDFNKACSIAGVDDVKTRQRLLNDIENPVSQAKIIVLKRPEAAIARKGWAFNFLKKTS